MKTKDKLLLAAEQRFLQKGYTATTVDEICSSAGATKGAFFHHFPSKEALALTVVEAHGKRRFDLLTQSPDLAIEDPAARVFAFVDHVTTTMVEAEEPTSLVASLTLELAGVNAKFRAACDEAFTRLAAYAGKLLDEAMASRHVVDGPSPQALADQFMATYHGALVLARARGDRSVIKTALGQYREHVGRVLARSGAAIQVA